MKTKRKSTPLPESEHEDRREDRDPCWNGWDLRSHVPETEKGSGERKNRKECGSASVYVLQVPKCADRSQWM